MNYKIFNKFILSILAILLISTQAYAEQKEPPIPDSFAEHKMVLQISDNDPTKQDLVLNVAGNLLKYYGIGSVDLEIVAFGPGVRLMMKGNPHFTRMQTLMDAGVRFSACENTLVNFSKKLGYRPELLPGVMTVPAGAARIMQLNAAGYQLLKP